MQCKKKQRDNKAKPLEIEQQQQKRPSSAINKQLTKWNHKQSKSINSIAERIKRFICHKLSREFTV